jgi:hypothetical protein
VLNLALSSNVVPSSPTLYHPDDGKQYVPPKRRLLQEPPGIISQKTAFFIVTVVNLKFCIKYFASNIRDLVHEQKNFIDRGRAHSKGQNIRSVRGEAINVMILNHYEISS